MLVNKPESLSLPKFLALYFNACPYRMVRSGGDRISDSMFFLLGYQVTRLCISMDRISDSDSEDAGSIPARVTWYYAYVVNHKVG